MSEYIECLYGVKLPVTAGDDGCQYVKHDDLERVIMRLHLSPVYQTVICNASHTVVLCELKKNGSKAGFVTRAGESVTSGLRGAIATDYPALTAFIRAFDRAALLALGVAGGKVLSFSEKKLEYGIRPTVQLETITGDAIGATVFESDKYVVPHCDLDAIIAKNPTRFAYRMLTHQADSGIHVVECKMYDKERDVVVSKVGESNSRTLNTDIAKLFPYTMAFNRAFDRAAISILSVGEKKVFSNMEIPKERIRKSPVTPEAVSESSGRRRQGAETVPAEPQRNRQTDDAAAFDPDNPFAGL